MFFKKKKDYSGRLFVLTMLNMTLEVLQERFNKDSARVDALEKRIAILEKKGAKRCSQEKKQKK